MRRKIFAVAGVMPEPAGFAAAKFSRTPVYKSYADWVMELTAEGAEKFYDTFYFQYGHASIADLAHAMVIVENISIPARNLLLDDQLIDVQSRSTRYVDYSQCQLIIPPEIKSDSKLLKIFNYHSCQLISLYSRVIEKTSQYYQKKYLPQKPKEISEEECLRTLKARAFDVARYLLPCAIPKSMGVIASGRTWERIITKFLSSPLLEFQVTGQELQKAICQKEAFNPSLIKIDQLKNITLKQKAILKILIAGKNIVLPTLVKYAAKNDYQIKTQKEINELLKILKLPTEIENHFGVNLFDRMDHQQDLAATMLYRYSPASYGQLLKIVRRNTQYVKQITKIFYENRGDHDLPLKDSAGGGLIFDICMDIGGFRDLHRHRNCIQVLKKVTPVYGFEMPNEIKQIGLEKEYQQLMMQSEQNFWLLEKKYPGTGEYLLPQATKRRFLMKMNVWELQYLTELRTRPQGHFSYRNIAYQMFSKFALKYPRWAKNFRVTNPKEINFFCR